MHSGQLEVRLERSMEEEYEVSVFTNPNWFEIYVSWDAVSGSEEGLGEPDIEDDLAEIVEDEYNWTNAELTRNRPDYSTEANEIVYAVKQNIAGSLLGETGDPFEDKLE